MLNTLLCQTRTNGDKKIPTKVKFQRVENKGSIQRLLKSELSLFSQPVSVDIPSHLYFQIDQTSDNIQRLDYKPEKSNSKSKK